MIEWTEQAAWQLEQAQNYIALSNSREVATQVAMQIAASLQHLSAFPRSGRIGRISGTRRLVIPRAPFIAAYTIKNTRVVILALYHGAQPWPDNL
ncbi:MAG TPA: type II toxin-antitoxin system RelE/ParE family toxin [Candidatus Acidoferrum sp.]|jgi:toxin ParE1/3/4